MHVCTDSYVQLYLPWLSVQGGLGFTEMELLLWMGPHQRRRVETVLSSDLKWNTPFSWRIVSMPPPPCSGHSQHAQYQVNRESEPHFLKGGGCRGQHFLLEGLPWLRGLGTEELTWLPGSELSSQKRPPPSPHTGCHHLSVARRHSLSQQMRGLSERAPQFLRDSGEDGSRHASLWFLQTVLLFVQAGPDHAALAVTLSTDWTYKDNDPCLAGCFFFLHSLPVCPRCCFTRECVLRGNISILPQIQNLKPSFQTIFHHKTKSLNPSL